MTKARKVTEITVEAGNTPGTLGKVSKPLADAGINIEAFCAYGMEDKGYCMFVCNNDKATETLKNAGWNVTTRDAVWVDVENRTGTLWEISNQLGEAGVNINYCYASTGNGNSNSAVFVTENNDKALRTLGG